MSKAIVKEGAVFKNHKGQFGKVLSIKGGFYYIAGWFGKKDQAEKAEKRSFFLNELGMQRAMGEILDGNQSAGEDEDSTDTNASDDPYAGFTNADLKEALKEAGLAVGGNRAELTARLQEAGIELVAE